MAENHMHHTDQVCGVPSDANRELEIYVPVEAWTGDT